MDVPPEVLLDVRLLVVLADDAVPRLGGNELNKRRLPERRWAIKEDRVAVWHADAWWLASGRGVCRCAAPVRHACGKACKNDGACASMVSVVSDERLAENAEVRQQRVTEKAQNDGFEPADEV